jgi:hypothetical protein
MLDAPVALGRSIRNAAEGNDEMSVENGEWIMRGLEWDNPYRIRTWQELVNWINEIGFLPLFGNEVGASRQKSIQLRIIGGRETGRRIPGNGERS